MNDLDRSKYFDEADSIHNLFDTFFVSMVIFKCLEKHGNPLDETQQKQILEKIGSINYAIPTGWRWYFDRSP